MRTERMARLRVYSHRETCVDHYPIVRGHAVVRWRGSSDPDGRGYIVEANIGGVIVEGAGHYGDRLDAACADAERIVAALASAHPEAPTQERAATGAAEE